MNRQKLEVPSVNKNLSTVDFPITRHNTIAEMLLFLHPKIGTAVVLNLSISTKLPDQEGLPRARAPELTLFVLLCDAGFAATLLSFAERRQFLRP